MKPAFPSLPSLPSLASAASSRSSSAPRAAFLRVVRVALLATFGVSACVGVGSLAACSDDASSGTTPSNLADSGSPTTPPETTSPTTPTPKDGGKDAAENEGPSKVTVAVENATYRNATAAGGGFVYAIDFTLANDSDEDVTSVEGITFDWGGGNTVSLTKAPCDGKLSIAKGKTRLVETQTVVSSQGSLTNFAIVCPGSQRFGGAAGKAPAGSTFTSPIAIHVEGKTASGTFDGSGSATPE